MHKDIIIRQANIEDYVPLANFLSFEYFIHRHLDWRSALDWLGKQPFFIAERNHDVIACFAAPNDVSTATWVRLFACSSSISREEIWQVFFEKMLIILDPKINKIGVLAIENWLNHLIEKTQFQLTQEIIVLERSSSNSVERKNRPDLFLRMMNRDDLEIVSELDALCFPALWQLPLDTMKLAFLQSGYATVIENHGKIIGYQITTENLSSAHLARIAVLPDHQNEGVAGFLLTDLINNYKKLGISRITVNTQSDNHNSLRLYLKHEFTQLPERYPVYTFQISQ